MPGCGRAKLRTFAPGEPGAELVASGWVADAGAVWVLTPLPGLFQTPLDVLVERDGPALQAGLVALQAAWATGLLLACRVVQRRAERKLVVQGG